MTSSAFTMNTLVPAAGFNLKSGTPKQLKITADTGRQSMFNFCGDCGSALWIDWPGRHDLKILKSGIIDGNDTMELKEVKPMSEQFTSRRLSWFCPLEGTMQNEGQTAMKTADAKIDEMEKAKAEEGSKM